jgi:hypothetical protein
MADNEKYIDNVTDSEINADDNAKSHTNSSCKQEKKSDTDTTESEFKPVEKVKTPTKTTKKASKSKVVASPSEMLEKIESRPQMQPPIRVPRVKKSARKKAVKVNTKTINRVVRFF